MLAIPSRRDLSALTAGANAVIPTCVIGFAREREDGRISVLCSHPHGVSEHVVAASELPDVLSPQSGDWLYEDDSRIRAKPDHPVEWQMTIAGVHGVVAVTVPGSQPATRFFAGLLEDRKPTSEQMRGLESLVGNSVQILQGPTTSEIANLQLRRLERVAQLLPALLDVLDVREVFDRLSSISQAALPHEMLTWGCSTTT